MENTQGDGLAAYLLPDGQRKIPRRRVLHLSCSELQVKYSKEPPSTSRCSARLSPAPKRSAKEDQQAKQLQMWEERALVWDRERRALERRLEKALSQQSFPVAADYSQADLNSKFFSILHKRQEVRIAELERLVRRLQIENQQSEVISEPRTQCTETDFCDFAGKAVLKPLFGSQKEALTRTAEIEAMRKALDERQREYEFLLQEHEKLLGDLRNARYKIETQTQELSALTSKLLDRDTHIKTLTLKFDRLAASKGVVSEAMLHDSLHTLERATDMQRTIAGMQQSHSEAMCALEEELR